MKLMCPNCKRDWKDVGVEYKRKKSNGIDYACKHCKSKRKPVCDPPVMGKRVLVIPDTHFPFAKKGYLTFLKKVYDDYNCDTVVHIGDLIDNHYSSFHETDPDGMSSNEELKASFLHVNELASVFPNMKLCLGNHCVIPARKAFSSGISSKWIKTIKDVLVENKCDVAGWEFSDSFIIDDVMYTHGSGRAVKNRMIQESTSVVQGHWHTRSSVEWLINDKCRLFAMQLGALIDDSAYAFAYARNFAKSFKNCGVVIEGKIPIIIPMEL